MWRDLAGEDSDTGVFSLTDNRKAVSSGSDCERQVLEFLKALIAFGDIEVSPGDFASALWPEMTGLSRSALSMT